MYAPSGSCGCFGPIGRSGLAWPTADDIKTHPWFESANFVWDELNSRQMPPTFVPAVADETDETNFDLEEGQELHAFEEYQGGDRILAGPKVFRVTYYTTSNDLTNVVSSSSRLASSSGLMPEQSSCR